ncbi:transposase [Bernardetia litoralis DSM 6794]|uniref:Transposase n=1 Tax=Bernardetia litoralis (strain ATCC 23117 / DSM 6794 / NBRC 15988 / NCIMB 1366 / Fx l1 / Sio-4) TaxID=880071 RepID=I4AHY8_BERLS|nr:transposase [Bernardetia litoralis]AFM03573.1 transposase [Bernardetia litoralis DSM 6794]
MKDKDYRKPIIRAEWWDYGWNGAYFITICTKNKEHFFGKIKDKKMELSKVGVIVDVLWHQLPHYRPYLELEEFIIMPNHIHAIITIDKPQEIIQGANLVSNRFQNQGKDTISSILGGFKSGVTRNVNRLGLHSAWQDRFNDHIIRDEKSYQHISNYIQTNVENWENDTFFRP